MYSPTRSGHALTREERLRADPLADVRGPQLVVCRLCGTEIKLSSKASYGLSHWKRHSGRCKAEHDSLNPTKSSLSATLDDLKSETDQKQSSRSRPVVQVASGSSPLKLKLRIPVKTKERASRRNDKLSEAPTSTAAPMAAPVEAPYEYETYDRGDGGLSVPPTSDSPSDDFSGKDRLHARSSSCQSSISDHDVTTPPDPHDSLPSIAIPSPSSVFRDGGKGITSTRHSDGFDKWTEGPRTTCPQEIVLSETFKEAENPDSGMGSPDDNRMQVDVAKAVNTPYGEVITGLDGPCNRVVTEPSGAGPSLEDGPDPIFTAVSETNYTALSSVDPPLNSQNPDFPSDEESDLINADLEYPEWDPPMSSSTFEQELRERGICLENSIIHRNAILVS